MSLVNKPVWRRFARMSAVRLSLTLGLVFFVIVVISGFVIFNIIDRQVRGSIDEDLRTFHETLLQELGSEQSIVDLFTRDGAAENVLFSGQAFRSASGKIYGAVQTSVFDIDGFAVLSPSQLFTPAMLRQMTQDVRAFGLDDLGSENEEWRVYSVPLAQGKVVYFDPVGEVEDALDIVLQTVWALGMPIVALTLILGGVLGWHQQKRLDRIREGITAIADGQFSGRLAPEKARDDLDDVMVGVDAAAVKLEQSFTQLRSFSQNLAHEMRTPLARLRVLLEETKGSEAALAQTDEVIRVFDAVQRITKLSGPANAAAFQPVDLGAVAQVIEDLYLDVLEESGQSFAVNVTRPAVVTGDFQLITQLLSNLVENANRYAGDKAHILLEVNGPKVTVSDNGPGLDPKLVPQAFQMFQQLGDREKGNGLGLALVRAIAEYHKAELTVETGPETQGLSVSLRFDHLAPVPVDQPFA